MANDSSARCFLHRFFGPGELLQLDFTPWWWKVVAFLSATLADVTLESLVLLTATQLWGKRVKEWFVAPLVSPIIARCSSGEFVLSVLTSWVLVFGPFAATSKANSSHLCALRLPFVVCLFVCLFVVPGMSNTKCLEGFSRSRLTISFRFICFEFKCGCCLNCHCRLVRRGKWIVRILNAEGCGWQGEERIIGSLRTSDNFLELKLSKI